ncbi:MAG: TIGR02452 family protein [Spirochaetae bacterium HGW-Spirochaetae-8]|nr:MAG: TIGR02452 family protein [Spirochaetae bacterium HGW-Spirochaetae-8]
MEWQDDDSLAWDARGWIQDFQEAAFESDHEIIHELRIAVYEHTLRLVAAGCMKLDDGRELELPLRGALADETVLYDAPPRIAAAANRTGAMQVRVVAGDTLEVAKELVKAGLDPLVLNMANRHNPGGGVVEGAGAQEEYLFRCSDYYRSLYQFTDYALEYGVQPHPTHRYPLNRETGGVYSPGVTIFRASEAMGYQLIEQPWQVSFVAVAAINRPRLVTSPDSHLKLDRPFVEPTRQKIRTIFRIAVAHGHRNLVLGAFGCGAFCNPPAHMAQLFHEVLREDEFHSCFDQVVFAIRDDHNSYKWCNPEGNLVPFQREFSEDSR